MKAYQKLACFCSERKKYYSISGTESENFFIAAKEVKSIIDNGNSHFEYHNEEIKINGVMINGDNNLLLHCIYQTCSFVVIVKPSLIDVIEITCEKTQDDNCTYANGNELIQKIQDWLLLDV